MKGKMTHPQEPAGPFGDVVGHPAKRQPEAGLAWMPRQPGLHHIPAAGLHGTRNCHPALHLCPPYQLRLLCRLRHYCLSFPARCKKYSISHSSCVNEEL